MRIIMIIGLVSLLVLAGCKASNKHVQYLGVSVEKSPVKPDGVPVYDWNTLPPNRSVIHFARITINGNGYADYEYLKGELGKEAGRIGADCAYVEGGQTNHGPIVTSYGNGIAISDRIQTLSIWGAAGVFAPSRLGVQFESSDSQVLKDVDPSGSCGKVGIKIGEKIMAINGRRTAGDPYAIQRVMMYVQPGQSVKLEVADKDGNQRIVEVIAGTNE